MAEPASDFLGGESRWGFGFGSAEEVSPAAAAWAVRALPSASAVSILRIVAPLAQRFVPRF